MQQVLRIKLTIRLLIFVFFVLSISVTNNAYAGTIDPPFAIDNFSSKLDLGLTLLPAWTGLPDPVFVDIDMFGPTSVEREITPFVQGGRDTIDTEIVSLSLTGSAFGFPVQISAGAGNGFLPGLTRSGGQIQDLPASPQDFTMDFPVDSFFDVFIDIWIDLDSSTTPDFGEVVRNFDGGLRMRNNSLSQVPPALDGTDPYISENIVNINDPNIGMFNATMFLASPLNLYVVNLDGTNSGLVHAMIDPDGGHVHTPVPEPSTFLLIGSGLLGLLCCRRKLKK